VQKKKKKASRGENGGARRTAAPKRCNNVLGSEAMGQDGLETESDGRRALRGIDGDRQKG